MELNFIVLSDARDRKPLQRSSCFDRGSLWVAPPQYDCGSHQAGVIGCPGYRGFESSGHPKFVPDDFDGASATMKNRRRTEEGVE